MVGHQRTGQSHLQEYNNVSRVPEGDKDDVPPDTTEETVTDPMFDDMGDDPDDVLRYMRPTGTTDRINRSVSHTPYCAA